jgi:hypothetical protein
VNKGFKEECFDKTFAVGFGEFYEKNQRVLKVNLNKETVDE